MSSFSTKFVLISVWASAVFVGCGKSSDNELGAASGGPSAGTAGEAGRTVLIETGGVGNLDPGVALGGIGGMPAQATVECGQAGADNAGAAGASEECGSPPPSVCADGLHLTYYSSAGCLAHVCQWTAATLDCPDHCSNGACVTSTTEK